MLCPDGVITAFRKYRQRYAPLCHNVSDDFPIDLHASFLPALTIPYHHMDFTDHLTQVCPITLLIDPFFHGLGYGIYHFRRLNLNPSAVDGKTVQRILKALKRGEKIFVNLLKPYTHCTSSCENTVALWSVRRIGNASAIPSCGKIFFPPSIIS